MKYQTDANIQIRVIEDDVFDDLRHYFPFLKAVLDDFYNARGYEEIDGDHEWFYEVFSTDVTSDVNPYRDLKDHLVGITSMVALITGDTPETARPVLALPGVVVDVRGTCDFTFENMDSGVTTASMSSGNLNSFIYRYFAENIKELMALRNQNRPPPHRARQYLLYLAKFEQCMGMLPLLDLRIPTRDAIKYITTYTDLGFAELKREWPHSTAFLGEYTPTDV